MESQNGWSCKRPLGVIWCKPLLKQDPLEQAVWAGFDYDWRWRFHNLSWKSVPVLCQRYDKKHFFLMFRGNLLCWIEKNSSQFFQGMVPGIKLQMCLMLWMFGELAHGWTWPPSPEVLLTLLGTVELCPSWQDPVPISQAVIWAPSSHFSLDFTTPSLGWMTQGNNKRLWNL